MAWTNSNVANSSGSYNVPIQLGGDVISCYRNGNTLTGQIKFWATMNSTTWTTNEIAIYVNGTKYSVKAGQTKSVKGTYYYTPAINYTLSFGSGTATETSNGFTVGVAFYSWNTDHATSSWTYKIYGAPSAGYPSVAKDGDRFWTSQASRGGSDGDATLWCTASGGSNASVSSTSITVAGETENPGARTSFGHTTRGLKNNINYTYYASVVNNAGLSASLPSTTFYISPREPLISASCSSYDRTSATFSRSGSTDTNRTMDYYTINYGTSTSYGYSTTSNTISGLTPNTYYYWKITGTDKNNGGPYTSAMTSNAVTGSFKTTCNAPSSLSLSVTDRTTTSISLYWNASGDTNADITQYVVYYKLPSASTWTTLVTTGNGNVHAKTLTGLSADQNYQFYFKATNAGGTTTSSTYTFSTLLPNPTISSVINVETEDSEGKYETVNVNASISPSRTLYYQFSKDNVNWSTKQTTNSMTYTVVDKDETPAWNQVKAETAQTIYVRVTATKTSNDASDTTATKTLVIEPTALQVRGFYKVNGSYRQGKIWIKANGVWRKAYKIYRKTNGSWWLSDLSTWPAKFAERCYREYHEDENITYIEMTGGSGWEEIYKEFTTVPGKLYTISFDYKCPNGYTPMSGYTDVGIDGIQMQVIDGNIQGNWETPLNKITIPSARQSNLTKLTFTFTAASSKTYLNLNLGGAADGTQTKIYIGNIVVK